MKHSSFPTLTNTSYLDALQQKPVSSTPVWMMRQAGRYLPEYKQTRAAAGDFLSLCKNTELATEVTLQPLRRFELDAAILFSDILTVPDAFGLGLYFEQGEGPKFKKTVRTEADVLALKPFVTSEALAYVTDAVTSIRYALGGQVPLIGFSGSPWTLATYMIEGGSSRDFRHAKALMYQSPELMDELTRILSDQVAEYLVAQVHAGAQALQIFDSWGGALSHASYLRFSLQPMRRIVDTLKAKCPGVPVTAFTKGGGIWLDSMLESGADALGLDWTVDLKIARAKAGQRVALQGNLDPMILLGSKDEIRKHTQNMMQDAYGNSGMERTGYIANLGHGIGQWTDPDHAKVFIDTVKAF